MRTVLMLFLTITTQLILLVSSVKGQVFSFERAIPGNIAETTIYGIVQDHHGFIWFATRDGLWRFDGHNTTEYRYDPADTTSISSSFVRAITVDRQGNLWVGTSGGGLNRYVPEYDHFQRYMYDKGNSESLSHNDVLHIYQDRKNDIWVCTEDGYNKLDQEKGTFKRYYLEEQPLPGLHNRAILSCLEDSQGNFWVGSYFRGLFKFDRDNETFEYFDLNKLIQGKLNYPLYNIWSLMEDGHNNLWIGTHNQGLYKYNLQTGEAHHFHREGDDYHQISSNIIYRLMEDEAGRIWIGTDRGLNIYDPEIQKTSSLISSYEDPTTISTNSIWAIMEDSSGTVWLGGWEGYADKWDQKSRRFTARMSEGIYPPTPLHYNAILKDSRDRLLVGTNSGLLIFPNFSQIESEKRISVAKNQPRYFSGLYISAIIEDSFGDIWIGTNQGIRRFNNHPSDAEVYYSSTPFLDDGLAANFISSIMEDSRKTIWVGTQNGLHQYIRYNNTFGQYHATPFVAGSLSHKYVTYVYEDHNGVIWAGTQSGLNRLNQSTGSFSSFHHVHNNPWSLANGVINTIFQDSRGLLWIGTTAGISCAIDLSGYFRNFTVDDGLPGNIISGMYEDNAGYLWVTTNQGVSRLDVELSDYSLSPLRKLESLMISFWNFTDSDGMIDISFKRGSVARLSSGEVLFGGTFGISSFFPDSIKANSFIPPIHFTDLKINNRSVKPAQGSKLLEKHISLVDEITLNHKQSVVTFDFLALGFTNSDKNQYAYIMKGFDKEWIYSGSRRNATYTNLNPGKYVFMVKASNNDGIWNEDEAMLEVTVLPPPWKTWPAFLIYLIILSATVFGFAQLALAKQKVEGRLKIQKLESEKIKELNFFKSVFFTNISHEFRTPLTLIIGPLSDIIKNSELTDGLTSQVKLIQKNALRLLRLINQLLDISKVEAGHVKLRVAKGNIAEFVSSVCDAFKIKAEKDGINYRFYTSHDDITCYFDGDKVEKILYNLLSNAFKYTPPQGKIDVLLFQKKDENKQNFIELIVHDSGPGIVLEKQKKIFERYFVLGESKSPWQSSTGIGLSLANQLALVHKGKIELESVEGKGSRFMVRLPVYKQAYNPDEMVSEMPVNSIEMEQVRMLIDYESTAIQPQISADKNLPIALLVEDNRDVREYIADRLAGQYRIITAADGQQGFGLAIDKIPDIIVSDVMMPVMDGFEMCRKIKSDERTSHIPLILLTAKVEEESRVEGYEMGADGYIPKPFQMARLQARMRNLIESRNKLRDIFGKRLSLEPSEVFLSSVDETFIQKAIDIIEKNISEPELNVEMLCSKIGMSRSQAFRKFKAITDLSPIEFIRMIRIKRSAQLLEQKVGNISEIAYMVGFSDLDYFRKCFKEQFGVTPTKYMEKQGDNNG